MMGIWSTMKNAARRGIGFTYDLGTTALTAPINLARSSLSLVDDMLGSAAGIIKEYPIEAARLANKLLLKYPAIGVQKLADMVEDELNHLIEHDKPKDVPEIIDDPGLGPEDGPTPDWPTPPPPDPTNDDGNTPPDDIQLNLHGDYQLPRDRRTPLHSAPQSFPTQPILTYWYWWVQVPWPVIAVVCPWHNMSPHQVMYVPFQYFQFTRGRWNRCGFCGRWSVTP